jgi:sugar (pentulose or hexulose) kinase
MSQILTIDAGTGGGRAVVFDPTGRILAFAAERWTYDIRASPAAPFVNECSFDPEAFWAALCRCVRRVLDDGAVRAEAIAGVVATSQREGCVFLDAAGREIYAGPNLDARGFLEALEAQEAVGSERLHAITGHAPPFIFPLARYLWFRRHRPQETVDRLLMISDWIAYRLTGEMGMEPSNASESMLFDVRERAWSHELLERLTIPPSILPSLRQPGERIGFLTAAAAVATGLRAGTPVVVGGADTQCALLGSGACAAGDVAAILGTTAPVQMVLDRPLVDPAGSLWTGCHVVADRWVLESNSGDTGGAYGWLLDLLGASDTPDPHATAEAWVRPRDPGARPTYALIGPSIFDLSHINPFKPAGILFPFPLAHVGRPDRGEILRAFFENIAFAVRGNCEQIARVSGRPVHGLLLSGGMSKGRLLPQILADVMEEPVRVSRVAETAALGCAMLGAVGLGLHPGVAAAVGAMAHHVAVEPSGQEGYGERYRKWRELYTALDDLSI